MCYLCPFLGQVLHGLLHLVENPKVGWYLSYVPDKVAEDLVNNLINILDTCDQEKIPAELKIVSEEDSLNTPAPAPENTDEANNNYVDLSIDSWLTIDSIGIPPAVENICLIEIEDFLEEF